MNDLVLQLLACAPDQRTQLLRTWSIEWAEGLKRAFPDEPLETPLAAYKPMMESVFERLLNEICLCDGAEGGKA